jgi:nucleoside-diphosphate-sugar epimerase
MKIAFLGGTRFIGHVAAERAVACGHDVTVLHRGRHPCEVEGATSMLLDRGDPGALSTAVARLSPDVLVDTRAMTRADAETTALALRISCVPAVVLSSMDVYAQLGRLNGLPAPDPTEAVTEDAPLTIPFPFRDVASHEGGRDYDKKDVEAVFQAAEGIPGVRVLRLPAVYGRRDPKRRFGWIVDSLDRGVRQLPCTGGASFRMTMAHVEDVAHAILLAAERPPSGFRVFNVGESVTPTMRERSEALAAAMGIELSWREEDPLPHGAAELGRMANDLVLDDTRLRGELGFAEVTTPDERHRDTIEGLRESRARLH